MSLLSKTTFPEPAYPPRTPMCLSIHVSATFTVPARTRLPREIVRSFSPLVLSDSGLYTGDKEGAQSNGSRRISGAYCLPDVSILRGYPRLLRTGIPCLLLFAFSALITFFHPDPKYSNIIFQLAPLLCNQLGLFDFTDMDVCIEHVILPFARPCKF